MTQGARASAYVCSTQYYGVVQVWTGYPLWPPCRYSRSAYAAVAVRFSTVDGYGRMFWPPPVGGVRREAPQSRTQRRWWSRWGSGMANLLLLEAKSRTGREEPPNDFSFSATNRVCSASFYAR